MMLTEQRKDRLPPTVRILCARFRPHFSAVVGRYATERPGASWYAPTESTHVLTAVVLSPHPVLGLTVRGRRSCVLSDGCVSGSVVVIISSASRRIRTSFTAWSVARARSDAIRPSRSTAEHEGTRRRWQQRTLGTHKRKSPACEWSIQDSMFLIRRQAWSTGPLSRLPGHQICVFYKNRDDARSSVKSGVQRSRATDVDARSMDTR